MREMIWNFGRLVYPLIPFCFPINIASLLGLCDKPLHVDRCTGSSVIDVAAILNLWVNSLLGL